MAEQLRKAIADETVDLRGAAGSADSIKVTASLGVTALEPDSSDEWKQAGTLFRAAEGALYAAKTAGRNCVRVFSAKSSASDAA